MSYRRLAARRCSLAHRDGKLTLLQLERTRVRDQPTAASELPHAGPRRSLLRGPAVGRAGHRRYDDRSGVLLGDDGACVGRANRFVSHAWMLLCLKVLAAIEAGLLQQGSLVRLAETDAISVAATTAWCELRARRKLTKAPFTRVVE